MMASTHSATPPAAGRKRFQFSLRRLLIGTTLASLLIGLAVRLWYFERVQARESMLRYALLRDFLAKEFLSLDVQKKKEAGIPLQFNDEKGIVAEGHSNFNWTLQFLCTSYEEEQLRTCVEVKITYVSATTGAGRLSFKFSADQAGFESRLRNLLDQQGWEYEISPPPAHSPPAH